MEAVLWTNCWHMSDKNICCKLIYWNSFWNASIHTSPTEVTCAAALFGVAGAEPRLLGPVEPPNAFGMEVLAQPPQTRASMAPGPRELPAPWQWSQIIGFNLKFKKMHFPLFLAQTKSRHTDIIPQESHAYVARQ